MVSIFAYCILRNISHVKYSCKKFCNLRHDYVNCCFSINLWSLAHKKTSKKKDNSHNFNMVTEKMIYMVFWLRNTHLKILELFCC